jgi:hypothetical protein
MNTSLPVRGLEETYPRNLQPQLPLFGRRSKPRNERRDDEECVKRQQRADPALKPPVVEGPPERQRNDTDRKSEHVTTKHRVARAHPGHGRPHDNAAERGQ